MKSMCEANRHTLSVEQKLFVIDQLALRPLTVDGIITLLNEFRENVHFVHHFLRFIMFELLEPGCLPVQEHQELLHSMILYEAIYEKLTTIPTRKDIQKMQRIVDRLAGTELVLADSDKVDDLRNKLNTKKAQLEIKMKRRVKRNWNEPDAYYVN